MRGGISVSFWNRIQAMPSVLIGTLNEKELLRFYELYSGI